MTSTAPDAASATIPQTWPGAFAAYKYSRQAVLRNLWLLVSVILGFGVLSLIFSHQRFGLLGTLLSAVVSALGSVVLIRTYLADVHGKKVTYADVFGGDLAMLSLKMFCLNLLILVTLAVSFVLFIVPFFFVLPRLQLAQYYLVDKDIDVLGAFSASWAATKGNALKVWGVTGVSILMALLFITIIGIPFAFYLLLMYSAATAVLYATLSQK